MLLACLKEDLCEFVTWAGDDIQYPLDINNLSKYEFTPPEPGDVYIRSKTGELRLTRLSDFQANWYVMNDISDQGLQTCCLVGDALEIVRWSGVDATYPYWFVIYMFESIAVDHYDEVVSVDQGNETVIEGDVFIRNDHDDIKFFDLAKFLEHWSIIR